MTAAVIVAASAEQANWFARLPERLRGLELVAEAWGEPTAAAS